MKSSGDAVFMTRIVFEWIALSAGVAYVFYESVISWFILLPGIIPYVRMRKRQEEKRQRGELCSQFRESILAVATAMNAGYSVENAFVEASHDMRDMYGEDERICREYRRIVQKLRDNQQIENILMTFAYDTGVEEIRDFAGVFESAKRIGGDMTKIINKAASDISEKIEVKREIETSVSAKKYEIRVMEVVPFGILIYLRAGSGDFMSVLYHNTAGILIMTAALALYAGGVAMAEKILDIEV